MKRILFTSVLIAAMLFSACGSTPSVEANPGTAPSLEVQPDAASAPLTVSEEGLSVDVGEFTQGNPEFTPSEGEFVPGEGGEFMQGSMVIGRVKSIVGNSVELELAKFDEEQMGNMRMVRGTPDPNSTSDPDRTPFIRQEIPEGGQGGEMRQWQGGEGGQRPEGGQWQDGEGGQRIGGGQGGRMGGGAGITLNAELEYTGETEYYILPVGMQIGTGDYTTVTSGMVLSLMLNEDNEVLRVSVVTVSAS